MTETWNCFVSNKSTTVGSNFFSLLYCTENCRTKKISEIRTSSVSHVSVKQSMSTSCCFINISRFILRSIVIIDQQFSKPILSTWFSSSHERKVLWWPTFWHVSSTARVVFMHWFSTNNASDLILISDLLIFSYWASLKR